MWKRETIIVRQGKGKKDRIIPIGTRALYWIDRYLTQVRPSLVLEPDDTLFLSSLGETFTPNRLTQLVRDCAPSGSQWSRAGDGSKTWSYS
jgi:integrase/recombinase XerD